MSIQCASFKPQSFGLSHPGTFGEAFQCKSDCTAELGSVIQTAANEQATQTGTTSITANGNAQLS